MSWLEKLDSDRVRAAYRDDEGRRRSKTFDRRADAKAWLAAKATDRACGEWIDPRGGAVLFSAWAEQWSYSRDTGLSRVIRDSLIGAISIRCGNDACPL